jgi:hypothetical protein
VQLLGRGRCANNCKLLQQMLGQHPLFYPLLIYLLLVVGVQVAHFHFPLLVLAVEVLVGIERLLP